MKFCAKCGQQIHDEAVICVHCGCSTESVPQKSAVSPDYSRLKAFADEAKTIHVLGILSLALCLGIGLIFQIINLVKLKQYTIKNTKGKGFNFPKFNLTNQNDIYTYETAMKKIKTASTLTAIGFAITVLLIWIIFMMVTISSQM